MALMHAPSRSAHGSLGVAFRRAADSPSSPMGTITDNLASGGQDDEQRRPGTRGNTDHGDEQRRPVPNRACSGRGHRSCSGPRHSGSHRARCHVGWRFQHKSD
jgi:hypothetical protein